MSDGRTVNGHCLPFNGRFESRLIGIGFVFGKCGFVLLSTCLPIVMKKLGWF